MPCSFSTLDHQPSTPEVVNSAVDRRFGSKVVMMDGKDGSDRRGNDFGGACSSSSLSSIGKNSDDEEEEDEEEVESSVKIEKSDQSFSNLDAFQESLPFRKGISRFYNGKSKSFASLRDATTTSSIKDITKPENAYSRRKRNLLAYTLLYENNDNKGRGGSSLLKSPKAGGISKRPSFNSTRSALALAVAMDGSNNTDDIDTTTSSNKPEMGNVNTSSLSRGSKKSLVLSPSPLIQRNIHPWRSFSVMDLQHCSGGSSDGVSLTCGGSCLSPTSSLSERKNSDQVS